MRSGFLYQLLDKLLCSLKYVNLVELFKFIGCRLVPKNSPGEAVVMASRVSVDVFIVMKWLIVLLLILCDVANSWLAAIVWYLLVANLYTYFYYHTWSIETLKDQHFDAARVKHRFLKLSLAILFSAFGFAYLYYIPYSMEFSWGVRTPSFSRALLYSVTNSLTASYDQVRPITDVGNSISVIQLVIMFIFITIIIGGSIPQAPTDT